jgi:hypothetical protein
MLKKIALSTVLLSSSIFADQIEIISGWNLLGSVNEINVKSFQNTSCVKSAFSYDENGWSVYHRDIDITNTDLNIFDTLPKGKGYWVYNDTTSTCTLDCNSTAVDVNSLPIADLTQEQKDDLVFIYQEEKVARDIYITLYNLYGSKIFDNISQAEQKHMDSVKSLLEKYEIEVPVLSDTIGEFELPQLQSLYDELLAQGQISQTEAFKVGEAVEVTDIADLEERIVDAPVDITAVYQSLLDGSYKHLDAFRKQL